MKEELYISHYRKKRKIIIAVSFAVVGILYMFKNASLLARSLSTIGLLVLFYLVDHLFDMRFKDKHYFFMIIIALTGFMLSPLYFLSQYYDKALHFVLPMLFASIVFFVIDKIDMGYEAKIVFTFFIIIGVNGLHEIGEYLLDYFFNLQSQGVFVRNLQGLEKYEIILDRIDDTMIDMIIGTLGAAVYSLSKYFFFRRKLLTRRKRP